MATTSNKWKRLEDGSYTIDVSLKRLIEVVDTKKYNRDDLEKYLNDQEVFSIIPYGKDGDTLLLSTQEEKHNSEELPYGIYSYKYLMRGTEILIPVKDRKEFYASNLDKQKEIAQDLNFFINSKSVYDDLGILHRRGYLFYGPPGTGKTAFIRNFINKEITKDSYILFLDERPSVSMLEAINELNGIKIVVLEEIAMESGKDAAELLRFLDGNETLNNCVIFATTNYPELLEKNLADRPSRFDVMIEMDEMSEKDNKTLYEAFLKREIKENEVPLGGMTAAHIKEICLLHLIHKITLKEAYDKVKSNRIKSKNNFKKNTKIGL